MNINQAQESNEFQDNDRSNRIVLPQSYITSYLPAIISKVQEERQYGTKSTPRSVIVFEALCRIGQGPVLNRTLKTRLEIAKATGEPIDDSSTKEEVLDNLLPNWKEI